MDDNVGLLVSELKRTGLWGRINIIVTSDHGMAQCSAERLIRLDRCLHPDSYAVVDLTPVAAIVPLNGNVSGEGGPRPFSAGVTDTPINTRL